DLREQGESLIDDQGIVFEGREGVTPVDNMRRQFVARTGNEDHGGDRGQGRRTNDRGERDRRDNRRPPGRRPDGPVPRAPQALRSERRTEEPLYPATRAWSLPSPHDLRASTPGMNEAVKIHMDHMHDRLTRLVDDSLGVRFKFPDGVKPRRAEGKHIRAYAGGHKFSQLEDWAMDVCYHLAACCYGGDDMDQERIFVLHEFIDGDARNWFRRHVLHTNRDKHDWTFKEVLIGLYNRFVNAATMQEAREAFRTAVYDARTGVQTFYDDLVGHAQNMAVYPDEFTIRETFLDGIPAEMRRALIRDDNLSPEVNTVTEFLAYAIRYEQSARTASHYDQRSSRRSQGQRQPVKVGTFLAKRSEMERNRNPRFVVRRTLPAGHKPALGSPGNASAARDARYGPGVGQPGPKATRDAPPKVAPPKARQERR
ncbi:hypothetical protein C0992_010270, partial [Termitomyces sp. T32_za158]